MNFPSGDTTSQKTLRGFSKLALDSLFPAFIPFKQINGSINDKPRVAIK